MFPWTAADTARNFVRSRMPPPPPIISPPMTETYRPGALSPSTAISPDTKGRDTSSYETSASQYGGWALGDRQRAANRIAARLQRGCGSSETKVRGAGRDSPSAAPRQTGSHPVAPLPRRRPAKRNGKGKASASLTAIPQPASLPSRFAPRNDQHSIASGPSLVGSPQAGDTLDPSMIFSGAAVYDSRGRRVRLNHPQQQQPPPPQQKRRHHGRKNSKSPSPQPEVLGPSWLRNSPSPVPWRPGGTAASPSAAANAGDTGVTERVLRKSGKRSRSSFVRGSGGDRPEVSSPPCQRAPTTRAPSTRARLTEAHAMPRGQRNPKRAQGYHQRQDAGSVLPAAPPVPPAQSSGYVSPRSSQDPAVTYAAADDEMVSGAGISLGGRTAVPGKNPDGTMLKHPDGRDGAGPSATQHLDERGVTGDAAPALASLSPEPQLTIHFSTSGNAAPFIRRSEGSMSLTGAAIRSSRARRRNSKPTVAGKPSAAVTPCPF